MSCIYRAATGRRRCCWPLVRSVNTTNNSRPARVLPTATKRSPCTECLGSGATRRLPVNRTSISVMETVLLAFHLVAAGSSTSSRIPRHDPGTKNSGTKKIGRNVAASIPPNARALMKYRFAVPFPLTITKGTTPSIKAEPPPSCFNRRIHRLKEACNREGSKGYSEESGWAAVSAARAEYTAACRGTTESTKATYTSGSARLRNQSLGRFSLPAVQK